MTMSYKLHHSGTNQGSSLTLTDYTMTLSYKLHHSVISQGSSLTLADYTMTLSYKLHHSGTNQGSSLTLTDYTMTLSYKLHHSGTKQGSSLTLTDYTMALSYKLHHSGTNQDSSVTLTEYNMTLSYKLHHSGTKQGNSLTLTDYTMTLSYKLHHSGTKQEKLEAFANEQFVSSVKWDRDILSDGKVGDVVYWSVNDGCHDLERAGGLVDDGVESVDGVGDVLDAVGLHQAVAALDDVSVPGLVLALGVAGQGVVHPVREAVVGGGVGDWRYNL
uniref:Uncharacterized protein n=1 Tax=Timema genevievae TaxID=629358 RepID=A0A7R9K599_TIMGE|nr:unnamed protein product [Timema genevievae]